MSDPHWYKDAVIYELHVRAFFDSADDGMGDFPGLIDKLDYLQDLGVNAIWLLPYFPSPWKDDGYDIADYTSIHPAYGNLREFQAFLREAHRRGLRVIGELVMNHTSDQHEWFQRARRARPGSRPRNFYVWSDTPEKYRDARIIFQDFEPSNWTWDPVAKAYYWHRFYSHQPDLNFDNPEVRAAMLQTVDFWFDMGVDGLRLDAVPYLYEREGTICENLPETHAFLKEVRAHVDARYPDRMLLAEANQWPEDAVAYFGAGDECHMAFHFPAMPRLFMALRMEDRFPITEILRSTPAIPGNCQWALFLRNHDELTLEMVSDEERDFMYRVYAQDRRMRLNLGIRRRLAPLLENDRRRIELMNALLLSLPGTPVIYYGDEIGMGDNVYLGDRNGVRTPMQWSADRNAGFSRANPQRLYLPVIIDPEYHYEAVNVETQHNNPHSLLWWTKRALAQRRESRAFGRGTLELLYPENRRVLVFVRVWQDETILVVANLSRFAQHADIDLSRYAGMTPVEMFGRAEFPPITDRPWPVALGPHAFYWFLLQRRPVEETAASFTAPTLAIVSWETILAPDTRTALRRILPGFLRGRGWFLGRRPIRRAEVDDVVALPGTTSMLVFVRVEYREGDPDIYVITLAALRGEQASAELERSPEYALARLEGPDETKGVLFSAARQPEFTAALLGAVARRRRLPGERGEVLGSHTRAFRRLWEGANVAEQSSARDHTNTLIFYGERFVLKLFRHLEHGQNPEREIGEALGDRLPFVPVLAGALEYRCGGEEPITLGVLHGYVGSESDGWTLAMHHLGLFFEHVQTKAAQPPAPDRVRPAALATAPPPELAVESVGSFLEIMRLLGNRTARLHLALAAVPGPAFEPEPYTDFYRVGLYHGILAQANRMLQDLRSRLKRLPEEARAATEAVLASENSVRVRLHRMRDTRFQAVRIRNHGTFELRNVLYTGKDFVLMDFEGNPERPISERRLKQSPLRDVAGMLRSLHYAAHAVFYGRVPGVLPAQAGEGVEAWLDYWYRQTTAAFLRGYLETPGIAPLLPPTELQISGLLDIFLLDYALQDAARELQSRPEWLRIPLRGIIELLDEQ